jgi:hypothetical protein
MRLSAALLLALAACAHATIPGTNIPDNEQTRAVLDVFGRYKNALEGRDPSALYQLAAPNYYDAGDMTHGQTPTDYQHLQQKLTHDFDNLAGVRLDATIKDVAVKGDQAQIDYFAVLRYAVKTPRGEVWKPESDDARMKLVRVGGEWKIQSGL